MPLIVYTHPHAKRARVFLCGLGEFESGVAREADAVSVSALLGAVVDGRFELNPLFSPAAPAPVAVEPEPATLPPAEAGQSPAPTAQEGDTGQ